jgi:hypothetical protein
MLDTSPRGGRRALAVATPIVAVTAVLALTAGVAAAQTANQGRPPFASGTLQSVSGSTLQVDGFNGTTTVVVTSSTKYEQTKAATTAVIAKGECVRVSGTGSVTAGIQAATVSVTTPSSKGCTQPTGFGNRRGNGNGTGASGRTFPNRGSRPTGGALPNGAPIPTGGTRPTDFATAFGSVSSVSGSAITVKAQVPTGTSKNGKPKTKTEKVAVTLADSTTVTQTTSAKSTDLAVGSCVTANGTTDSVGTVKATNVVISQPENGSCTRVGGLGGGGLGRFGTGNAATAGQTS